MSDICDVFTEPAVHALLRRVAAYALIPLAREDARPSPAGFREFP